MRTSSWWTVGLALLSLGAMGSERPWTEVLRDQSRVTQVDLTSVVVHGDYDLMDVDALLSPLPTSTDEAHTRGVEQMILRARYDCHQPGRYQVLSLTGYRLKDGQAVAMKASKQWQASSANQPTVAVWRAVCLPEDATSTGRE